MAQRHYTIEGKADVLVGCWQSAAAHCWDRELPVVEKRFAALPLALQGNADDVAQSKAAGQLLHLPRPETIADGLQVRQLSCTAARAHERQGALSRVGHFPTVSTVRG